MEEKKSRNLYWRDQRTVHMKAVFPMTRKQKVIDFRFRFRHQKTEYLTEKKGRRSDLVWFGIREPG